MPFCDLRPRRQMLYRANEVNASLAAINSKENGLQYSHVRRGTAKQGAMAINCDCQLVTPRL